MAIHRINLATVSWISRGALGVYATPHVPANRSAAGFEVSNLWLYQLAFGMFHAANPDPPPAFSGRGYVKGQTLGRQYRGLMTCDLELDVDPAGAFKAVRSVLPIVPPDPGYTPRFDDQHLAALGADAQGVISSWKDASVRKRVLEEAGAFHAGEASTLSRIAQPPATHWQKGGTKPLEYGSLPVPKSEIVLAHGILKFRVAESGDYLAIIAFGAPNHVPWVWCEVLLCYTRKTLKLYCAGSLFPSHDFYLNGQRRALIPQVFAPSDLRRVFTSGLPAVVSNEVGWSKPYIHEVVNQQVSYREGLTSKTPIPHQNYTVAAQRPLTVVVRLQ